jgi:hypothetical protein
MQGKPYRVRRGTSERPRRHSIGRLKTASWDRWTSPGALGLGIPAWRDDDQIRPLQREQEPICLRVHVRAGFALFTAQALRAL